MLAAAPHTILLKHISRLADGYNMGILKGTVSDGDTAGRYENLRSHT